MAIAEENETRLDIYLTFFLWDSVMYIQISAAELICYGH
jgi:hypothetical protein